MENSLPIVVFDLRVQQSIVRAASGQHNGTTVGDMKTTFAEASAATR